MHRATTGAGLGALVDSGNFMWNFIMAEFQYAGRIIMSATAHLNPIVVGSLDPNDKASPAGFSNQHFIPPEEPLNYVIYFENLENASAPAQEIKVTDRLDQNLDWGNFSFGDINIAGKTIDISEGSKQVSLNIPMTVEPWQGNPVAENINLNIEASFNSSAGIIEWKFEGRNITTGELADFLIPNKNPPKGDGWVMFTVNSKQNLSTGTKIKNKASIVFDVNPPMDTPEVFNTIDSEAPSSYVEPLPENASSSEFDVRWNGTEGNGSGIKDYTIYVSIGGKPYKPWLVRTTNTSAIFIGDAKHTYAFYSIARDNVGNIEDKPNNPDATTFTFTGTYLGAYLGCGSSDLSCESIQEFNQMAGKPHAIFSRYVDIKDSKNPAHWQWAEEVKSNGAMPLFVYDPWDGLDAVNTSDVEYFANKSKELNTTIFIVFGHEMNGYWYPWGNKPGNYTNKFKEVAEMFHRIASDVKMVWAPNQNWGYPWGGVNYGDGYSEYYPEGTGAYGEYVDWVGLIFYDKDWDENNLVTPGFFTANIKSGQNNTDFYQMFAVGKNKPMLISETGAFDPNKDPTTQGERNPLNETEKAEFKNEWLKQVYNVSTLKEEFPRLNAIIYFHANKTETIYTQSHSFYNIEADYRIPESPDVYKNLIADPYFIEAQQAPLLTVAANRTNVSIATSPISPTPVEFAVMLGSTPVSGAVITLSGAAAGSGSTDANGTAIIMVSPTMNGTITAAAAYGANTATTALTAKGDVSGDNRVSITDALFIAQHTAGLRVLDSNTLVFADVSGDGRASITDALFIAQATAGIADRPVPKQGN